MLFTLGPSHTRAHTRVITPSSHVPQDDSRFNRHSLKAKDPKKSRVKLAIHKDDEFKSNQYRSLGSPIRLYQSSTPVSDNIDDDHSVHDAIDDGGVDVGVDWKSPCAFDSKETRPSTSGALPALGGVSHSGASGAADVGSPDLLGTKARSSRSMSRSATLAKLDTQIQELSTQIDAFREERESLLRFVATQREWRQEQHHYQEWEQKASSPSSEVISRAGDDQSDAGTREESAAVKVCIFCVPSLFLGKFVDLCTLFSPGCRRCIRRTWRRFGWE